MRGWIIEAVAAGRPIIFGPHMENFAMLARSLVAQRGAIEVRSAPELQNAVADLLRDSSLREMLVQNARMVLNGHRGATSRTTALIVDL